MDPSRIMNTVDWLLSVRRHSGPVLITKHYGTCENSSLHINQVLHYVPFNCWLMRVSNQPYGSNSVHFRHEELISKNLLQLKVSISMRKRSGGRCREWSENTKLMGRQQWLNNHLLQQEVCRRACLKPQHIERWSRWPTVAGDHVGVTTVS